MWILLGTVFVASLLGSLHCVGMCGPFALLASSNSRAVVSTGAYSLGRLVSYTIVGVIFGSLGLALNRGTSFAPWQQTATFVAGGMMIAVGVVALLRQIGWKVKLPGIASRLQHVLQKLFRPVIGQPPIRKAFLIGALTCLMPCGWLYTFAIVAAGTGSPVQGAVVMIVFWSGTVPIMAALMLGFNKLNSSIQKHVPVVMAVLVIGVGIFTIAVRAPVALANESDGQPSVVVDADQLVEQIRNVDHSELPCCSEK